MRTTLPFSHSIIRASIKDFLDNSISNSWSFEVSDEPGISDFQFSNQFGDLGSVRIIERPANATLVTSKPPLGVHKNAVLELIVEGKLFVEEPDFKVLSPVIKIYSERATLGIGDWDVSDYFMYSINNPGKDLPSNTPEEIKLADPILEKYVNQINRLAQETHEEILDALQFDLRLQEIWPEPVIPQTDKSKLQTSSKNTIVLEIAGKNQRLDLTRLEAREDRPGKRFDDITIQAFIFIISEMRDSGTSWLDARKLALEKFCGDLDFDPEENYDRILFFKRMQRCLDKAGGKHTK